MRPQNEEIPVEAIARIVHGAHRDFQVWTEDPCPAQPWDTLDPRQRDMVINMVRLIQQGFPYDYVHQIWVDRMTEDGWRQGAVKDPHHKRHPSMVKWEKLPYWEQQKVVLAFHIVQGATSRGR